MILGLERQAPCREQPGKLAGFFVVACPLHRLARAVQLGLVLVRGIADAASAERSQRLFGARLAVYAGRPKKDHRVLSLLLFEAAKRLEILRQDTDRPRLDALEKLRIKICQRLMGHVPALYQML